MRFRTDRGPSMRWMRWWWIGAACVALSGCPAGPAQGPDPMLIADPAPGEGGGAPGAGDADFDRGVAFIKREAYREAISYFEKVLAKQPQHAQAEYYRALAHERLGEREAAQQGYERALELDPKLPDAAVNLGAMYLDEDPDAGIKPQPGKAIQVLSRAVEQVPDDPGVHENLAFAYRLTKKWDQAAKHYDAALKLGDSARIRFAYGDMLHEAERCDQAVGHLEKAVSGFRQDFRMLVTLGDLLARCQAYRGCVEALDGAIQLQSGDPQWYVRRGVCYHGLKKEQKARADYQTALKKDPKFVAAYYYLGQSYRTEGNRGKAAKAFEQAVKLDKQGPVGKRAKAALSEMAKKR